MKVRAPGKLVVMGEYAVLYGHPAIVAAVDVDAVAHRTAGPLSVVLDADGLLQACIEEVQAVHAVVDGALLVDTSAFRDAQGRKLGLGSSAAACVAFVRVLLPDLELDALHRLAQRAHRRFQQSRGSGIDVAASVYGGACLFQRHSEVDDDVSVIRLPLPTSLALRAVWSGRSQDTRAFVSAVTALPDARQRVVPIAQAVQAWRDATSQSALLQAVEVAAAAMQALGVAAGVDIVSAPLRLIDDITRHHGGRAKPSGAGGGDVALCFVDDDNVAALALELQAAGFAVLPLQLHAPGVCVVPEAT